MSRTALTLALLAAATMLLAPACGRRDEGGTSGRSPSPAATARAAATGSRGATTPIASPTRPPAGEQAVVTRVVDGDTIDVRRPNGTVARIRYIGVNTPETVDPRRPVECYGEEAKRANERLVAGQTVVLEKDVSETDRYDRLLRYVWVGERMVNATLVAEGLARVSTFPPDVRYQDWLLGLDREARAAGRGLWGACR